MRLRVAAVVGILAVVGLLVMADRPLAQADLPMAKPETVGVSSKRLERVKAYIQEYIDTNQIAGAVTLIARKGKVVHHEAQGWRVQGRQPADAEGHDLHADVDDQADRVDGADDALGRRQVHARRPDLEVAAVVREPDGARERATGEAGAPGHRPPHPDAYLGAWFNTR